MRRGYYTTLVVVGCALFAAGSAAAQPIAFVTGPPLPVFSGPDFAAVGDFNGDGFNDVVVSHYFSPKLGVLLTKPDGSGTFDTSLSYPAGRELRAVVTGDFNGDGILDLAVADFELARVFVLYGQGQSGRGNGTFGTPHQFTLGAQHPIGIATGNFDNQNGLDLVTANGSNNTITILLNQGGNKGFTTTNVAVGSRHANPKAIATADFNGDGLDDIAVVNSPLGSAAGEVAILLNNNQGSFQTANTNRFVVGMGARALTIADFNGDGVPDIAVLNSATSQVNVFSISVLLNNTTTTASGRIVGTGFFTVLPAFNVDCPPQVNGVPVTCTPQDIESADFNGDGFMDLAVSFGTNATSTVQATPPGFVTVYAGRGDGNFDFATQSPVGLQPRQLVAADFTGDGLPDILVTEFGSNTVRILRDVPPPPKGGGSPCTSSATCSSKQCVDGVCCDSNSCPSGEFCNIQGQQGSCAGPAPNGNACTSAAQCQSGNCVDGFCCSTASCPAGQFCNAGTCAPPAGNGTACTNASQCSSGNCVGKVCCGTSACPSGQICNAPGSPGTCATPVALGNNCTDPTQCQSTFCVDHTCCSVPACDPGFACDVPGNAGVCTLIPTQTPVPSQTPVPTQTPTLTPTPIPTATTTPTDTPTPQPSGAPCANGTQCMSGFCIDTVCCSLPGGQTKCPDGYSCNVSTSMGSCAQEQPPGGTCSKDSDCQSGNCSLPSGTCAAARTATPTLTATLPPTATLTPTATRLPEGAACTTAAQCQSGLFCTGGACCVQAQCPSGQSCNVLGSQGQCTTIPQPNGTPCSGAGDCLSGNCTDGYCCDMNPCPAGEFCDIDTHEGTCSLGNDVGGPCNVNADCAVGLVCLSGPPAQCGVPPIPTPTLPPFPTPTAPPQPEVSTSTGGGCSIGGADGAGAWMLAALPIVLWLRRRREWVPVERRRHGQ